MSTTSIDAAIGSSLQVSSSDSSTSPSITSLGVGTGIDVNSIVNKLVSIERLPITDLQTQVSQIQTTVSAVGQIKSDVNALETAAQALANPGTWNATTGSSNNSAAVSITSTAGAAAATYNVAVSQLAMPQSVVTNTSLSSSSATVGSGSLTISLGSWSGSSFTQNSSTPVTINVSASDSLSTIASNINAANAGVSASILNDASGSRLVITSSTTGASNGFKITANDSDGNNTDGSGLSSLAYDPSSGTTGTTLKETAQDSQAIINGVAVTSTTNTYTDVLPDVSLTVSQLVSSSAPVVCTVAPDTKSMATAVSSFASAYSDLATYISSATAYDSSSKQAGVLEGNAMAVNVLNQLREALGSATSASSTFPTLESMGLDIQVDGSMVVDGTQLNSALQNVAEMKKAFATATTSDVNASSSLTSANGFGVQILDITQNMLSTNGAIASQTNAFNTQIKDDQAEEAQLDDRANMYEQMLKAQYTALDTTMAGISGQGSYITNMIAEMNKS